MKRKEAVRMAWSARAEAYLRMRYAYLTQDDPWASRSTDGPLPEAVQRTLDAVCLGCLNEAINQGNWSSVDKLMMDTTPAVSDVHIH